MITELLPDLTESPELIGVYGDWLEDRGENGSIYRGWVDRIDFLTPAQVALMPAWRDYWLKVGLRTEDDQATSADHIRLCINQVYAEARLPPPDIIVRLDSPLAGATGAVMLTSPRIWDQVWAQVWDQVSDQVRDQVRNQVRDQVGDQVRDQVGDQVRVQVWDQVRAQVRNQVWDQVGDQVGVQVWDQVGAQVWAQVGDQVRDQVGDQVRDQVYQFGYGAHDAGWLSFYSYLLHVGRMRVCARLLPLMRLSHLAGWWWPFQNVVIVTPPPCQLTWRRKKLSGFRYPDGWEWKAATLAQETSHAN